MWGLRLRCPRVWLGYRANGGDVSQLEAIGCAFLDISSGGLSHQQKIPIGPGYQVPFAAEVKAAVNIPLISVGLITDPAHAEPILRGGPADLAIFRLDWDIRNRD